MDIDEIIQKSNLPDIIQEYIDQRLTVEIDSIIKDLSIDLTRDLMLHIYLDKNEGEMEWICDIPLKDVFKFGNFFDWIGDDSNKALEAQRFFAEISERCGQIAKENEEIS